MDDSFAERMRNRALQRLQKNAHIIKSADVVNKENINSDTEVKPIIAEHLTIKKSLSHDIMDCDISDIKKSKNTCGLVLTERNFENKGNEDVYVKHCKNRLANLAGKFKKFEEEDSNVPIRTPNSKQTTLKRKSAEKELQPGNTTRNFESVSKTRENHAYFLPKKPERSPAHQYILPTKREKLDFEEKIVKDPVKVIAEKNIFKESVKSNVVKSKEISTENEVTNAEKKFIKPKTLKKLDPSVAESLESQGYKRTESDAHLIFDFKKARSVFDKDGDSHSNSKSNDSADPSLLSVAERRKLFERRLRGEEVPTTFGFSNSPSTKEKTTPVKPEPVELPLNCSNEVHESETSNDSVHSEYTENYEEEVASKDYVVLNISEETCSSFPDSSNAQDADISVYPVLQTVKPIKFVSTPKPGRLYPSVSDLDCDADENEDEIFPKNLSRNENNLSIGEHDNSFGRDLLFATNSIFNSFQTSKKEFIETPEKSSNNVLAEVKDLISADDVSFSLSPVARSSISSIECPNETASFTFKKAYSDTSGDISPILAEKNNSKIGTEKFDSREYKSETESDVEKKIKVLEEQIIKEKMMNTQAIRALRQCLSTSFVNSLYHLEAEKFVLLIQLKIVAIQNEIDRIKVENSVLPRSSAMNYARGNVVISNIKLPLRMTIVHADLKDDVYNNLLCVIKCGDIVLSTEVMPVIQSKIKQEPDCTYVEFPDTITVTNVGSDFKISIEVYNLVVERKENHNSKKEKKNHHGKKEKGAKLRYKQEDKKYPHSSFVMVGYMIFSLNEVKRHQWILNKQDLNHTPLVGMILMNLKCNLALTTIQKHGFLTMYEVISGYGAWSRYWFNLNGEKLSYWKYPEEESVKDPIGTFELRKCCTVIDVVGIEITMRPHTFMLQFNPTSYLLEFKRLTEDGLLLSADNLEGKNDWCSCLNEVLKSIQMWSNAVD